MVQIFKITILRRGVRNLNLHMLSIEKEQKTKKKKKKPYSIEVDMLLTPSIRLTLAQ
jgi:hypothetical protein